MEEGAVEAAQLVATCQAPASLLLTWALPSCLFVRTRTKAQAWVSSRGSHGRDAGGPGWGGPASSACGSCLREAPGRWWYIGGGCLPTPTPTQEKIRRRSWLVTRFLVSGCPSRRGTE